MQQAPQGLCAQPVGEPGASGTEEALDGKADLLATTLAFLTPCPRSFRAAASTPCEGQKGPLLPQKAEALPQ